MEVELITGEQAEMIVTASANTPLEVLNKLRSLQGEQ
jgi:hypothetical protein